MWLVVRAMRRPGTVIVVAVTILLSSALAIRRAPADIFPDLGVPVIYVVQPYAGMSPSQMEAQLATADDVAQVQRLLVEAETDDALARLDVWRALLFTAYANGDLAPFLAQYRGAR